jgi:hypothetical protein
MLFASPVANVDGFWMKKLEFDVYGRLESVGKDEKTTGGWSGTYNLEARKSLSTGDAQPMMF